MGTLGTYLKNAREARGLDLREAAQQTRISHAYLVAIEKEDFAKLPGEVFVKGFLRNYAKFLGVGEDEVMRLYAESKTPLAAAPPPPVQPAAKQEAPKKEYREPAVVHEEVVHEEGRGGVERYIWAALALTAVVAALLVIVPERHHDVKHEGPVHSGVTGTDHLATAPASTVRPEKLYLDVTALEDMWVLVRTDSSPQKKAVLKKGETVTWSADERFLLSIGNVSAAKIVLNGKELTINAPAKSAVRDVVITATGLIAPKVVSEQPRPRRPKPAVQKQPQAEPGTAPATQAPSVSPAPAPGADRPTEEMPRPEQ